MRLRALGGLALLLACRARFTGPYPCVEGFASCVEPQQNMCETDTTTDGLHCGACGTRCGVGAPCVASRCGQTATVVATLDGGSQTQIQTNSSAVFWQSANSIVTVPVGAPPDTMPTELVKGTFTCNGGKTFAVDDGNLYFWSNGGNCMGQNSCAGLTQFSLSTKTTTLLVSASQMSGSFNACGSFALSPTTVYWLTGQTMGSVNTYSVYAAQIGVAGQTLQPIATADSYNGSPSGVLGINATSLVFVVQQSNFQAALAIVPLAGGSTTKVPLDNTFSPNFSFVVDDTTFYAAMSSCPCNGNNGNNGNNGQSSGLPPQGRVVAFPLDSGPSKTLATFSGLAGGIGLDGPNVYWSSDTTAWKVPRAGGPVTPVAGNLTNGAPGTTCNGSCGPGQGTPTALAVGASGVYISVPSPENAVLEVGK
jgi:hypothetical protein